MLVTLIYVRVRTCTVKPWVIICCVLGTLFLIFIGEKLNFITNYELGLMSLQIIFFITNYELGLMSLQEICDLNLLYKNIIPYLNHISCIMYLMD